MLTDADRMLTDADRMLTDADRILTYADRMLTDADRMLLSQGKMLTALSHGKAPAPDKACSADFVVFPLREEVACPPLGR